MIVCGRETTKDAHMTRETKDEIPRDWPGGSQEHKTMRARRVQSTNTCLPLLPSSPLITTHTTHLLLALDVASDNQLAS